MRRRGSQGDRRALLEEAFDALTLAEYGAMIGAFMGPPYTSDPYRRLVELAGVLGMPAPPSAEALGVRGTADEWAYRSGLLHPIGACRGDRGEHWAFQCGK